MPPDPCERSSRSSLCSFVGSGQDIAEPVDPLAPHDLEADQPGSIQHGGGLRPDRDDPDVHPDGIFLRLERLARDLYTAASNWCSHIKGGLAIATVFACGIFGAMSGASTAAASVMSKIAMPEMRRHGYSDELAAGAIGIGATLDILIPPSIAMVIYGVATQTSIGKLLIAGIIPGLIAGVLLAVMIYLWVVVSPKHAPSTFRVSREERWASLVRIWPSLLLIFLVLLLLYTGIATPTEVGALGALLAGIIGAVFGRLTLADALDAVKSTIRTSAMIFLILIGATIFGYYMALSRIPQDMVSAVTAMDLNRWVVIIGIVVAYFIIGVFSRH